EEAITDYADGTGGFVRGPYTPGPGDLRGTKRDKRGGRRERQREQPVTKEKPQPRRQTEAVRGGGEPDRPAPAAVDPFVPYGDFTKRVEEKVREAMSTGASFSIVGCRLSPDKPGRAPASGVASGVIKRQLLSLASVVVRAGDIVSINDTNDLVVLLAD